MYVAGVRTFAATRRSRQAASVGRIRLVGSVVLTVALIACGPAVASQGQLPGAIPSADGSPMPSAITGACQSAVDMGVLPTWARAGFSDPDPAMPHVLSRSGAVVAILFGYPLASPPREGINNKILWVHRDGPTPAVEIGAQRMDGTTPVGEPVERRLDGGFAPSIVDLPDAGCWRLMLTYGDATDSIDLVYSTPTS